MCRITVSALFRSVKDPGQIHCIYITWKSVAVNSESQCHYPVPINTTLDQHYKAYCYFLLASYNYSLTFCWSISFTAYSHKYISCLPCSLMCVSGLLPVHHGLRHCCCYLWRTRALYSAHLPYGLLQHYFEDCPCSPGSMIIMFNARLLNLVQAVLSM